MTENEKIAREFAEQFTPALNVCKTERVNNVQIPDAWQISYWDQARGIGITTVTHGGGIHAYLEAAGAGSIAAEAGAIIAKALGLFQEK